MINLQPVDMFSKLTLVKVMLGPQTKLFLKVMPVIFVSFMTTGPLAWKMGFSGDSKSRNIFATDHFLSLGLLSGRK